MRLLRSLLTLIILGALVYFAYAVPLGQKTLWQHLRAIAGTKESKELVKEVKEKADEVIHHEPPEAKKPGDGGDELTPKERKLLRRLIKDKLESGEKKPAEAAEADSRPEQ